MPACPACGVAMTPDEWNTGSCFACRAPLLEQKRYYEPAAAFDPNSPASVKIKDYHRPAWGTVRTGLLLQIVGVLLLWLTAFGLASLDLSFHPMQRLSPGVALMVSLTVFAAAGTWLCLFAGYGLCAAIPPVERVRQWMWISLAFTSVALAAFGSVMYMAGTNTREEHLQAKREAYLKKLDLRSADDQEVWQDVRWSENAILAVIYVFWGTVFFATAAYVLFIWSLAGIFRRRLLQRIILALCTLLLITVSSLQALATFESLSPTDVSRGLQEASVQQAGNALLFIAMLVLTIYAGCCWKLRDDIATLLRGEHLR